MRRALLVLATVASVGAAPAGAEAQHGPAPPEDNVVTIPGRLFAPGNIQMLVGESVIWRNGDTTAHLVRADDRSFESPRLAPGDEFTQRFDRPGRYAYHCTLHRHMRGTVDVASIGLRGPEMPLRAGAVATLQGRAPVGVGHVTLERLPGDGSSIPVATAIPDVAGSFAFPVVADAPARYRVRAGELSSLVVAIPVMPDIKLQARRTPAGRVAVDIHVPGQSGARLVLERHEREFFGYVPLRRLTLRSPGRVQLTLRTNRRLRLRVRVAAPVAGYSRGHSGVVVIPRHGRTRSGGQGHH